MALRLLLPKPERRFNLGGDDRVEGADRGEQPTAL